MDNNISASSTKCDNIAINYFIDCQITFGDMGLYVFSNGARSL